MSHGKVFARGGGEWHGHGGGTQHGAALDVAGDGAQIWHVCASAEGATASDGPICDPSSSLLIAALCLGA